MKILILSLIILLHLIVVSDAFPPQSGDCVDDCNFTGTDINYGDSTIVTRTLTGHTCDASGGAGNTTVDYTAHGWSESESFTVNDTQCGFATGTTYYVCNASANDFQVDQTKNCAGDCSSCDSVLDLTTDADTTGQTITHTQSMTGRGRGMIEIFSETAGSAAIIIVGNASNSSLLEIHDQSQESDVEIRLFQDRPTAGVGAGAIIFNWGGVSAAPIASIEAFTGADTTNKDDGGLIFKTRDDGDATPQTRLTIAQTGDATLSGTLDLDTSGDEYLIEGGRALSLDGTNNVLIEDCAGALTSGTNNICIGKDALDAMVSNGFNVAIGTNALASYTGGVGTVGVGVNAGRYNQTGTYNTYLGAGAGAGTSVNSHGNNTIVGGEAGNKITTAGDNTLVGMRAGFGLLDGPNNIFIGHNAGDLTTSGGGNIVIGNDLDTDGATVSNYLNIGGVILGDPYTSEVVVNVDFQTSAYSATTGGDAGETTLSLNNYNVVVLSLTEDVDNLNEFSTTANEICYTGTITKNFDVEIDTSFQGTSMAGNDNITMAWGKGATSSIDDGSEVGEEYIRTVNFSADGTSGMGTVGAVISLATNDCLSLMAKTDDTTGGSGYTFNAGHVTIKDF